MKNKPETTPNSENKNKRATVNEKNGNTAKWIAIIIAAISLTFATVTGGVSASLNSRVKDNERDIRKIDVILEKIDNIEDDIREIKEDVKERIQ